MHRILASLTIAAVLTLADGMTTTHAYALPRDAPIAALESQATPAVVSPSLEDLREEAQRARLIREIEVLRTPIAVAPAVVAAPAPAASSPATIGGILGAVPWEVWGLILGTVAMLVFRVWTGPTSEKTRSTILALAEGAWYVAERQGGPGAEKYARALDAFVSAMGGQKLKVDPAAKELAAYVFQAKSAADAVARSRVAESAALNAAVPVDPTPAPAV